jgi:hypothetical protein
VFQWTVSPIPLKCECRRKANKINGFWEVIPHRGVCAGVSVGLAMRHVDEFSAWVRPPPGRRPADGRVEVIQLGAVHLEGLLRPLLGNEYTVRGGADGTLRFLPGVTRTPDKRSFVPPRRLSFR